MIYEFELDEKRTFALLLAVIVLFVLIFGSGIIFGIISKKNKAEDKKKKIAIHLNENVEKIEAAEEVEKEEVAPVAQDQGEYTVQAGAFLSRKRAEELVLKLVGIGHFPYIFEGDDTDGRQWFAVRAKDFSNKNDAIAFALLLEKNNNLRAIVTNKNSFAAIASPASFEKDKLFALLVSAYSSKEKANAEAAQLKKKGVNAYVFVGDDPDIELKCAVLAGGYKDKERAEKERTRLWKNYKLWARLIYIDNPGNMTGEITKKDAPKKVLKKKASAPFVVKYPYTVKLSSFRKVESAKIAVASYKKNGLSPIIVAIDSGRSGIWRVVYEGRYKTKAEAEQAAQSCQVKGAVPRHTPYTLLLGEFSTTQSMAVFKQDLLKGGFFPYSHADGEGVVRLFLGAFVDKDVAAVKKTEIEKLGIQSQVVLR